MEVIIQIFLVGLGIYTVLGFFFALYFVFVGAKKIDPLLGNSKKSVRLLLFPGVLATWPFLLAKLFKSQSIW